MKLTVTPLFACLFLNATVHAQPALTIYNQNFAVVRETIPLDLKAGVNQVRFDGATTYLEPSSVVLRAPTGRQQLRILEQGFRGDPVSQALLLELYEGKTIEFERVTAEGGQTKRERISGKVIRSGTRAGADPYGYNRYTEQPLIEVDGRLQFTLPGEPIFPALTDKTILKPTLQWLIETDEAAKFDAELSYVTGEMRWQADYNLVLPETGNTLDVSGWISIENHSGKSFEQARIKLMAGDVNKVQPSERARRLAYGGYGGGGGGAGPPPVTEKSFDEYHLYTLERPTTLLDEEKKQVEFVRAAGVQSMALYVYDGAAVSPDWIWNYDELHRESDYGLKGNKNVWVMREFTNSAANQLGLPLPQGRVRVYRRNSDGQMEFTGENTIKHTPRNEVIRLALGNAFDMVGERKRADYKESLYSGFAVDPSTGLAPVQTPATANDADTGPWIKESFEIKLRNHKTEPVEVRVVEHLYRWVNWSIIEQSQTFLKTDAQTIEFRVPLEPDSEKLVTYRVRYSW